MLLLPASAVSAGLASRPIASVQLWVFPVHELGAFGLPTCVHCRCRSIFVGDGAKWGGTALVLRREKLESSIAHQGCRKHQGARQPGQTNCCSDLGLKRGCQRRRRCKGTGMSMIACGLSRIDPGQILCFSVLGHTSHRSSSNHVFLCIPQVIQPFGAGPKPSTGLDQSVVVCWHTVGTQLLIGRTTQLPVLHPFLSSSI